ncbi:toprim domain-containing protein, partial [Rhizobium sp. TRM95111]|uniref:toprim domain-containing protein n=1 Tax=Rhizobium alarense TaxID=2846851 RepID=UPI001F2A8531
NLFVVLLVIDPTSHELGSPANPARFITESAIDAMSLAAFEGLREGSLYLSTGGGWSPATEAAVRVLASRPGAQLFAATDANSQGETFAGRLRGTASDVGCNWFRLTPPAEDWNDALRAREEERRMEGRRGGRKPHTERKDAGRVLMKEILALVQLQQEGEIQIASIGGFDLIYEGERFGQGDSYHYQSLLQRTGGIQEIELAVTVTPLGAISRLEHALGGFEKERERYRQRLEEHQRWLSSYQSR